MVNRVHMGAEQDQLPFGPTGTPSGDPVMSHATTTSPKRSFRAPRMVGDAVVGREDAGLITSKSRHPCPCQNCSHNGLLQKIPEEDRPSRPPGDPIGGAMN